MNMDPDESYFAHPFYSPTRCEPYSIQRAAVDRSAGVLAARAYLDNHHASCLSRWPRNLTARLIVRVVGEGE